MSSNKQITVGIIGAGAVAEQAHLPAFSAISGVEVTAAADLSEERIRHVKTAWGVKNVYSDPIKLLDEANVDAVAICTPNVSHIPLAKAAAERGIHMLIEKPIGTVVENELLALIKQKNVTAMVGMTHRFRNESVILKEWMKDGVIGSPYFARVRVRRQRGTPVGWFTNSRLSGGGAMMDIGVHALDLIWFLLSCPALKSVSGHVIQGIGPLHTRFQSNWTSLSSPLINPFDTEDFAAATIRFSEKLIVQLEIAWSANAEQDDSIQLEILGDKGGIRLTPLTLFKEENGLFTEHRPKIEKNDPFAEEIHHFIHCIRSNERPICDAEQGMDVLRMIQAIYHSSDEQREIII
ncbi:Gfo/Idh/MocA family protein [Jeotgalibacillus soli]|uniref:Oxidoreductase n=1 Tax=Jeotgalibacillus soli TaxID=889306 RepID=A0A0C2VLQ0_9BACL|nr:Gfo/Idh/MocA family oxidoreductase [Jeotgalibacillus soli]KIL49852.1 hypothetical protein KP78_13200 [Jeotgalibacillus soli]